MNPTTFRPLMFRRALLLLGLAVTLLVPAGPALAQDCGTTTTRACLTAANVMDSVRGAAQAIASTTMVIAVVDRAGVPLAVYAQPGAPATTPGNFGIAVPTQDLAVGLARTGAFFSNDQAPLSSRTVRFISGIHFPPGVTNKPPAALYGIENTNRGCAFNNATLDNDDPTVNPIPRARSFVNAGGGCLANAAAAPTVAGCGTGIATGKADVFDSQPGAVNGGGVPIFKDGRVAGGIGVAGIQVDSAEFAAFVGSVFAGANFGPRPADPGTIFLDGIRLPFVNNVLRPPGTGFGIFDAANFVLAPIPTPNEAGVPSGFLVGPVADASAGGVLTAADVTNIVSRANAQANRTRAAIRLPLGSATRMMIAVAGLDGTLLGVFRMPDATIFSIDVAVAKSRNAMYFSSPTRDPRDLPGVPFGTAVTARTIGFGAMPLFPAGIDRSGPGPFFGTFLRDVPMANFCTQGFAPATVNQNGIVFFPGSIGLYRGTALVGGLGVSGDGVEQDDLVTAAGAGCPGCPSSFVAPPEIRADRVILGGVRLPFFKFPRNPEIR